MAEGSHSTRGANDARVCCTCGKKLLVTGPDALTFYRDDVTGESSGWHSVTCSPFRMQLPDALLSDRETVI
jgi:hypothetical protein